MRRSLIVLSSLLLLAPSVAAAQSNGPTRAQVRELLSGIEDVPSDADWQRIGERVIPILMELANDANEPPYVRMRAVSATAAFPRPAVRTFLVALGRAEGQGDLMIAQVVSALGRAFGDRALQELDGYLHHEEAVVREAAARQLGRLQSDRARTALRAQLRVERLPHVRVTIERALR